MRILLLFFLILILNSCSEMKPEDYKNTKPVFKIEEYFQGNVKAWGMLQGRSGEVKRQFVADMKGEFDGENLILNETFIWNDGEKQERRWVIKKVGDNRYEGTAPDVIGVAKGVSFGSAFKFEYKLKVPYKNKEIGIRFDDWIFQQDEKTAINKATLSKFGFKVGELTVFFVKD